MDNAIKQRLPQLESVLTQSAAQHERLLTLMQRQRELLKAGDHHAVTGLSRQENELIQSISELEKQRQTCVAELTERLDPAAQAPMQMRALAQNLPEPHRGRLLVLRETLRQRIEAVREESSVTRRATEALARHLHGLVQAVAQVGACGAAYDPRGQAPTTMPRVGSLNLTA